MLNGKIKSMLQKPWVQVCLCFLLILIPVIIIAVKDRLELRRYGVSTIGELKEIRVERTTGRYGNEWYVFEVEFKVSGNSYLETQRMDNFGYQNPWDKMFYYENTTRQVKTGDQFLVNYSSRNPQVCKIVQVLPAE